MMKLEDILTQWEQDSNINRDHLDTESLNASKLHHKYHKIYTQERMLMRKYEFDLKQLRLDKFEFYTQGPTKETHEKGWVLPPIGKILKADAGNYVDADKEVVELSLKIGLQHEKIELLSSIIKSIMNRGFQIKNAIDWAKFQSGF
jgi:hypothetical protein